MKNEKGIHIPKPHIPKPKIPNPVDVGKDIGHKVEHGAKDIGHKIEHAGKDVGHALDNVSHQALHAAEHEAKKVVNTALSAAGMGIEQLAEVAYHELEKEIQEALDRLFQATTRKIFKQALNSLNTLEGIGESALKDTNLSLNLSILGLEWNDLGGRIKDCRTQLTQAIDVPPVLSRHYLTDIAKIVTPDRVGLSVDFQLAALVVTSSAVGGSFGVSVSRDAFLTASDKLLKMIGI